MEEEMPPSSFLRRYIFSTDHKVIGWQYLLVGVAMALVGGYLAYVFRWNLAFPGKVVPLFGNLDPQRYNSFVTLHGMIMFFWVAMPVLLSGLGNLLLPLMIGTDDMAFPRVNMLSFWIFFLSTIVLLLSFFTPTGPFAGGWTLYPPLSADAYRVKRTILEGLWTGSALLILAVALEFVSMLMGGINFITTTLTKRAPGMTPGRLPIFVWFLNLSSLIFMVSVGPLVAGAILLLLDIVVGTGFYDPRRGGDPILFQHLFWFFGHPEVYVVLFPSLGVLCEIIPVFARKPLFGYRWVIGMAITASVLSVVVWGHHQFVAGIDPRMSTFFSVGTILISVPFATVILALIFTLWWGRITLAPPMQWAIATIAMFLVGGLTGLYLGSNTFDIYAHDTYFVVAHFHYVLIPVVFMGGISALYYWYPKFTGRMYNHTLATLHLWGTIVGMNLFAFPLFLLGLRGEHRRIFDYSLFTSLNASPAPALRIIATVGTLLLILSQIPFFWNLIVSLVKGKPAEKNPWKANTLEWETVSPPPHGNFATTPVVYRWPYDYSLKKEGAHDFFPQTIPG
jgi:cytochrome c oxidase subunit 1